MMILAALISLLVGICAAGLVWYGWGVAENLRLLLRKPVVIDDSADSVPTDNDPN